MGAWSGVSDRLAPAENVRAALAMVERGQAPLGIVYVTDAASSDKVRILGFFPKRSHSPIRYPLVTVAGSHSAETIAYRAFLLSPRAQKIFRKHGFSAG
jgi:molybdate transport system substrate-binding protein